MGLEKPRANSVIQVGWDDTWNVLTCRVTGSGQPDLVGDMRKVSKVMFHRSAAHGVEQRIRDKGATRVDEKSGKSRSPREKYDAVKVMFDHIFSGTEEWNPAGGERIGADESLLSRALQEVYPSVDIAKIRADVTGMRPEERRAILTNARGTERDARIAAAAQRIKAADVADVDTEALLEGYA
jgi:hypothetical protein